MMKNILIFIVKIYQKTLSPDHGWLKVFFPTGYCKFKPTCSEYCARALSKYGAFRGLVLSVWRVLRCNPWSKGGYDPA